MTKISIPPLSEYYNFDRLEDAARELHLNTEEQENEEKLFNLHNHLIWHSYHPFQDALTDAIFSMEKREEQDKEERKKRQKEQDEREQAREKSELCIINCINASLALGEATAKAVQRIPDAKCNGDMHAALDYAQKVKHEQKDFLNSQALHQLY